MKKIFFCVSLFTMGLMTSCVDKYQEVDADNKPEWLGESIYAELENPNQAKLTGTFTTYLRLVNDLGYAETLNRTGSKTVFPANDDAFNRFFQNNMWGVRSYEQLSESQKKLLLYSSMLDNALLLGLLPNVSNGTDVPMKGYALKHPTNVSMIDTITHINSRQDMPQNNIYWNHFNQKPIDIMCDGNTPMMVHLTREYMLKNGITFNGDNSDFSIITGSAFTPGSAYIYNDRVIHSDVTCQNGYIQQMEDVIVPPGNMAEVLRRLDNTKLFSRIMNYYSAPYYDASATNYYNDWAKANGRAEKDSIFKWRYMSSYADGGDLKVKPDYAGGGTLSATQMLSYDPGWNGYYPKPSNASAGVDYAIMDMGAIFAPSDDAMRQYFLPGGSGSYLIDIYGTPYTHKANNAENLPENLDSLYVKNPGVLTAFMKLLMRGSFVNTVPSKFSTVTSDAGELMGLTTNMLNMKGDKHDITIANNGAIYVLNEMLTPDEYRAVLAPSSVYPDMHVMNWCVQDGHANGDYLGVDFKYYLLAMNANYAFFVPEDSAFNCWYLDPATLGHVTGSKQTPDALHFYYDEEKKIVKCSRHKYDVTTGEVEEKGTEIRNIKDVRSQLVDILNYHTVVLNSGEVIGNNHFYKTKHGGTIYVDGNKEGGRVMSGWQRDGSLLGRSLASDTTFRAPKIKKIYTEKNGNAYRLDRIIQPPVTSVYGTLAANSKLSEFLALCNGFGGSELLEWAGISGEEKKDKNGKGLGYSEQDAYVIFSQTYKLLEAGKDPRILTQACLDYNVKMFNTYNYTLFAPDNTAMQTAYANGLPTWKMVKDLYDKYSTLDPDRDISDTEMQDKNTARAYIERMNQFVRYHFVTGSIYADNVVEGGQKQTLFTNNAGVPEELTITGGGNKLTIVDAAKKTVIVDAGNSSKLSNMMTRDYWLNDSKDKATAIQTSSFCAVHQISEPLCSNKGGSYASRRK